MKFTSVLAVLTAALPGALADSKISCYLGTKLSGSCKQELDQNALLKCYNQNRHGVWLSPDEMLDNDCGGRKWYSGAKNLDDPDECHDLCRTCIEEGILNDHSAVTCVAVTKVMKRSCWMMML